MPKLRKRSSHTASRRAEPETETKILHVLKRSSNVSIRDKVATGEQCQNRIIFKQLMSTGGVHFVQIDSCRVAGLNEIILILLMAKKFNLPGA
jgi:L-alanine-DL-glutamate epimerase-like enolase superfamily enzyme